MGRVTAVIVTWESAAEIVACLDALRGQTVEVEVVVVDNGSSDDTVRMAETHPLDVRVVALPTNTGYAAATNAGVEQATTERVLLLNPDVVLDPDCVGRLLDTMDATDAVACGPRLRNEDGSLQLAALRDPDLVQMVATMTPTGRAWDARRGRRHQRWRTYADVWESEPDSPFEVDVQITAALVVDRTACDGEVFDERFPLYFNDGDLCRRLRRRGRVLVDPRAGGRHVRGVSTRRVPRARLRAEFAASMFRYADRWWSPWHATAIRLAFVIEGLVHAVARRLRGRPPAASTSAALGALGLPGGARPWFGPPASLLPDRALRARRAAPRSHA